MEINSWEKSLEGCFSFCLQASRRRREVWLAKEGRGCGIIFASVGERIEERKKEFWANWQMCWLVWKRDGWSVGR